MNGILTLTALARFSDLAFLALRVLVGAFLMWGTWDNLVSPERMQEFVAFLTQLNCPAPALAAPLSCYAQFACGALILIGLLTRWAALVMVFNFIVAVWLVHPGADFRALFPPLVMIAIPLVLATHGPGRYAADAVLARR